MKTAPEVSTRHSILFLSAVVALYMGVSIGLPALLAAESTESRIALLHSDERREATLQLRLRSFDASSRSITAIARITSRVQLKQPFAGGNDRALIVNSAFVALSYVPLSEEAGPGTYVYSADEFAIPLLGDPSRYPFDSYSGILFISPPAPEDYLFPDPDGVGEVYPNLLPIRLEIIDDLSGYSISYHEERDQEYPSNGFNVQLSRAPYDSVIFVLAASLLLGVVGLCLVVSLGDAATDYMVAVILGLAAIGVSLPGLRDLLVPDDIRSRTYVDVYLVVPFLVGALCVGGILAARALRSGRSYD